MPGLRLAVLIGCIALFFIVLWENGGDRWYYETVEGFSPLAPPRRTDVTDANGGEGSQEKDQRFFSGYADVQGYGQSNDFCRVLTRFDKDGKPDPNMTYLACALAGTENLDSTEFRSQTQAQGFKLSRDDYMRDVDGDGRSDYCRILRTGTDTYEAMCSLTTLRGISKDMIPDDNPPRNIKDLLWFYEGIMMWFRFHDDMDDYAGNAFVKYQGDIEMTPLGASPSTGLLMNGEDQFVRVGETPKMELSSAVNMRYLQAVCVWVRYDEFKNWSRVFDFGNGAGQDNVWLGIEGKGNAGMPDDMVQGGMANAVDENIVCRDKAAPELPPQVLLATSEANINAWKCPYPDPAAEPPMRDDGMLANLKRVACGFAEGALSPASTANLIFEVWDYSQRKMRIRAPNFFKRGEWVHVCITARDNEAFRPTYDVYRNGSLVMTYADGHTPQTAYLTKNYIGRSNWESVATQFSDKDERFKGSIYDLRFYKTPVSVDKLRTSIKWGSDRLGIEVPTELNRLL